VAPELLVNQSIRKTRFAVSLHADALPIAGAGVILRAVKHLGVGFREVGIEYKYSWQVGDVKVSSSPGDT